MADELLGYTTMRQMQTMNPPGEVRVEKPE
jgi:hypothetical protein